MTFVDFIMGRKPPIDTLNWLSASLMPAVQERLNTPAMRRRLGLYAGEVIPTNERNLTDTRNRVSLIYEYLFADTITEALVAQGCDEFCAYVVANRFPDLEVRNQAGERGLRLEVKCLQATAEEKSANFSTLLKDIDPTSDYLIVFLWEWAYDAAAINWDRAPLVADVFSFNAQALARLRDCYWLNRPSAGQGEAYQGYDLRGAITATNGSYKDEEGNYGKILRLWDAGFATKPPMDALLTRTETDYTRFKGVALQSGFETLSRAILNSVIDEHELEPLENAGAPIGFRRGNHWFVLNSKIARGELVALMHAHGAVDVILFADTYKWSHCRRVGTTLSRVSDPAKPKNLLTYLNNGYSLVLPEVHLTLT